MPRVRRNNDQLADFQRLQQDTRELRLREIKAGRFDAVTDLEGLLCGGWNAPFAVIDEPPEHTGPNFGAYRNADRVYWRGMLLFDGVTSQNPDRNHPTNDATRLFYPNSDAATASTPGSGFVLPQQFWPDHTLLIDVPVDVENSVSFTYGRWAQLRITYTGIVVFHAAGSLTGSTLIGPADTAGAINPPLDASNRVHHGVPNGTYLGMDCVNYRPRYSG